MEYCVKCFADRLRLHAPSTWSAVLLPFCFMQDIAGDNVMLVVPSLVYSLSCRVAFPCVSTTTIEISPCTHFC